MDKNLSKKQNKHLWVMLLILLTLIAITLINILPTNAISGGTVASPDQFPFAVKTIKTHRNGRDSERCGGVLIGVQWVLSANHCFNDYNDRDRYSVVVGSDPDPSAPNYVQGMAIPISYVYQAPYFQNTDTDIILLRLETPVVISSTVQPIAYNKNPEFALSGNVVVMGWGATSWGGTHTNTLRHYLGTIQERVRPAEIHILSEINPDPETTNMVCNWDSGSPGVKWDNDQYILLGTHANTWCDIGQGTSWLSDTSLVSDWIYTVTGIEGYDSSGPASATPTIAPTQTVVPTATNTQPPEPTSTATLLPPVTNTPFPQPTSTPVPTVVTNANCPVSGFSPDGFTTYYTGKNRRIQPWTDISYGLEIPRKNGVYQPVSTTLANGQTFIFKGVYQSADANQDVKIRLRDANGTLLQEEIVSLGVATNIQPFQVSLTSIYANDSATVEPEVWNAGKKLFVGEFQLVMPCSEN